ncbi:hypothetical protein L6164_026305 [Bauhinia variegata]|uniref:Uncharacterized protein n=2 Tax=Bauhinia variegata TaxID=167791 RepID=A0ACB9LQQ7_BAUVA|nr:hypothetical protein L6164_026305 [Bauhinia variegata]
MAETDIGNRSPIRLWNTYLYSFAENTKRFPGLAWRTTRKVGREDPRRVIHSLKVGLALTLVSLLYLMEPLFKGVGQNAMWAVMTVVVVMEFTAGATLSKGLNRGFGTVLAGSLAFLIEYVADIPGRVFRATIIGAAVFLIGAASAYVRFIPYMKKNYDYGVLIFLLTFNLITVSSYRVDDIWNMAKDRISTIAIGCGLCLLMCLVVFPNWSGEDLHNSTISKLEGLAKCIQDCVVEYFSASEKRATEGNETSEEDPICNGYKAALDSKAIDEALALQASWEPRFSRRCHRMPWCQYVKVGATLRHFSYNVVALHGCLQTEIQTPMSILTLYKDSCIRLAQEVSRVLMELASSIRNNRQFSPGILSNGLQEALQDLNTVLKSHPQIFLRSRNDTTNNNTPTHRKYGDDSIISVSSFKNYSGEQLKEGQKKMLRPTLSKNAITSLQFSETLPFAAFASLLLEMVAKLDNVIYEVEELGRLAHFREFSDDTEVVVTCERSLINVGENHLSSSGAE